MNEITQSATQISRNFGGWNCADVCKCLEHSERLRRHDPGDDRHCNPALTTRLYELKDRRGAPGKLQQYEVCPCVELQRSIIK